MNTKPLLKSIGAAAAAAVLAGFLGSAQAQIIITNGSFESFTNTGSTSMTAGNYYYHYADNNTANFVIDGWTFNFNRYGYYSLGNGAGTSGIGTAENGVNFLNLITNYSYNSLGWVSGSISQSFSVTAGQLYELSYYSQTNRSHNDGSTTGAISLASGTATGNLTQGSPGSLSGNGTSSLSLTGNTNDASWTKYSFSFTPTTTTTATLTFANLNGTNGGGYGTNLDNVSVVPEPTTWALIGLGFAFAMWNLRRRREING